MNTAAFLRHTLRLDPGDSLDELVQLTEADGCIYAYGHRYQGAVVILDVSLAGQRGAVCHSLTIDEAHFDDAFALESALSVFELNLLGQAEIEGPSNGYPGICFGQKPAIRVYDPSGVAYEPLKKAPKKWTLPLTLRAIHNGQYLPGSLKTEGVYTDDYAHDLETDYSRGEMEPKAFVRQIVEAPSGWRVSPASDGRLLVCCHHFSNHSFIPALPA